MSGRSEKRCEESKRAFVRTMFGGIVRRYELVNFLMTFGRVGAWRRFVVRTAVADPECRLLDVGCGTGALARAALSMGAEVQPVGVDFAFPMINEARRLDPAGRIALCVADGLTLPFADSSFDAVVSGFLLRNTLDVRAALMEQVRVVRPGGRVVALETAPPQGSAFAPVIRFFLRFAVPALGAVFAGRWEAYRYLAASTESFLPAEELAGLFEEVGLEEIGCKSFMFGAILVMWGKRSRVDPPANTSYTPERYSSPA